MLKSYLGVFCRSCHHIARSNLVCTVCCWWRTFCDELFHDPLRHTRSSQHQIWPCLYSSFSGGPVYPLSLIWTRTIYWNWCRERRWTHNCILLVVMNNMKVINVYRAGYISRRNSLWDPDRIAFHSWCQLMSISNCWHLKVQWSQPTGTRRRRSPRWREPEAVK